MSTKFGSLIDFELLKAAISTNAYSASAAAILIHLGLSRLIHQELHWLGIPVRVNYKLGVLTNRCLLGKAPVYLSNCCIPVSQVATRRHLRSAARHQLTVLRHRLSTYGRRAFAVAGPTMFNTLPDDLIDPAVSTSTFGQSLKTHLFSAYQHV